MFIEVLLVLWELLMLELVLDCAPLQQGLSRWAAKQKRCPIGHRFHLPQ
jgi:hypothetical protein